MKLTEENLKHFEEIILKICDEETSLDPDNWTPENPLWAHCSVVSMLAQDCFGGEILMAVFESIPEIGLESFFPHFWNKLPNGEEKDFTKSQFGDHYSSLKKHRFTPQAQVITKSKIFLIAPRTFERYKKLVERHLQAISEGNWEKQRLHDEARYLKR
jgi:hypothetical protein